jgi:hypothetical protein
MNLFITKSSTSMSFVKAGCCHTLLKDLNDFPTRTVHISWQMCVKIGTRELNIIKLSICQFPDHLVVNDTLYVGQLNNLQLSFYIFFYRIQPKKSARHVKKHLLSDCALCANWSSEIYIAYIRVWMYWCCCFTHWLSDLWFSCISANGRQYICCGPTLCVYRKITTLQYELLSSVPLSTVLWNPPTLQKK